MDQLMPEIDGNDPAHGTNRQHPAQFAPKGKVIVDKHISGVSLHNQPHRGHDQSKDAVDPLVTHGRYLGRLIGITGIFADHKIQHRNNAEYHGIKKKRPVILGTGILADHGGKGH